MSYDVQVYARRALGREDLRRLVREAGLGVDQAVGESSAVVVVRGAASRYCCTVGLPAALEPEDVPEEVVGVLLAPAFVYELHVEGSSPAEVPHAVRLARRLAQASEGVVLDQQTGLTWSRGLLRSCPRLKRGRTDVVHLRWYAQADDNAAATAGAWLDLARRLLPEALPRRFGPTEPLALSLDRDGPDAFVRTVSSGDLTFLKASAPCIEGTVASAPVGTRPTVLRPRRRRPFLSHGLVVHRDALQDADWRFALERFFVQLAQRTRAVYASAEVERGLDWTGRSLYYGAGAEFSAMLAPRGEWAGLPPRPVWWSWFGPVYAPLVVDHLSPEQVRRVAGGLFHARSTEPLDRDQLTAAVTPSPAAVQAGLRGLLTRRALSPGASWLPPALLATRDDSHDGVPLGRATLVPKRLSA